jgi:hypothetical protein
MEFSVIQLSQPPRWSSNLKGEASIPHSSLLLGLALTMPQVDLWVSHGIFSLNGSLRQLLKTFNISHANSLEGTGTQFKTGDVLQRMEDRV